MNYDVPLRSFTATILLVQKQPVLYNLCVFVALGMPCACAILSAVASPVLQYLSTLSHEVQDFRKKECY